jgi:hypothetical protein
VGSKPEAGGTGTPESMVVRSPTSCIELKGREGCCMTPTRASLLEATSAWS